METEQRYAIKFCLRLQKSATETLDLLQTAYGNDSLKRSAVFNWHKRFREGRESLEKNDRTGRPATSRNDEKINADVIVVNENRRITIRQVAEAVGISCGSAETILTEDLGMTRVFARWVPHLLIPEQNLNREFRSQEMLDRLFHEGQAFLHRIATGDECWIHFYEPESKRQSSEWKRAESPPPTKVRAGQSALKQMDHTVPKGSTVNALYYRDVIIRVNE